MRSEEEIKDKIGSLIPVMDDIKDRMEELLFRVIESIGNDDSKSVKEIEDEVHNLDRHILEVHGNIRALRWALGEMDDTEFALNTGASKF